MSARRPFGPEFRRSYLIYLLILIPPLALNFWLIKNWVHWPVEAVLVTIGLTVDGPLQRRFWPVKPKPVEGEQLREKAWLS